MDHKVVTELLNPVRIKIVQFALQKGETTSKELGELLPDIAIASLYRHIKKLIELEVLEIVSETPIRGTIERTFKVKNNPYESIEKLMDEGDANLHFQMYYSFLMSQLSDFSDYLSTEYNMKEDIVGFRTYPFYLSREESILFFEDLRIIFEKYFHHEPASDRQLRKFSFSMFPSKDR